MAKKAVSKLQTGAIKSLAKAIRIEKSEKSGAYVFKTEIIPVDSVQEFFNKK